MCSQRRPMTATPSLAAHLRLLNLGRFADALTAADRAIAARPAAVWPQLLRTDALRCLGRRRDALASAERVAAHRAQRSTGPPDVGPLPTLRPAAQGRRANRRGGRRRRSDIGGCVDRRRRHPPRSQQPGRRRRLQAGARHRPDVGFCCQRAGLRLPADGQTPGGGRHVHPGGTAGAAFDDPAAQPRTARRRARRTRHRGRRHCSGPELVVDPDRARRRWRFSPSSPCR